MLSVADVIDRLESRAANHGVEVSDLLEMMPSNVRDSHTEVNEWLDIKDVSHKKPVSLYPDLANDPDNIMWEDSDTNRQRGAREMTELEVLSAELDNELDARTIDGPSPDVPDPEWLDVLEEADIDIDLDDVDVGFPKVFPFF